MQYEYFYGAQAEQFSFYRIPKALFTEPNFRELSTDAKVLYGILLDRMSLSLKKSMVRCTEQGLHYLHRGGNHGCTELCQPESHAPDGGTGKAGRAYRAQATGAW